MCPNLSARLKLEDIQKDARELLHALQQGDPAALSRHYPLDPLAGLVEPRLAEAQYLIAREYGYRGTSRTVSESQPIS